MPFIILSAVAAIVGIVNLTVIIRTKRFVHRAAPGIAARSLTLAAKKSAASWSFGAALSGSIENEQPVIRLVSSRV